MAIIALVRVWPVASAKDRERGASGSTFGLFRRLGVAVGVRRSGAASDRRPLDRCVERLLAREECSGMIQRSQQACSQPPRPQGVRNGTSCGFTDFGFTRDV